jgi:hypothetical protein
VRRQIDLIRDYYTVTIERDFGTAEECAEQAIVEARERAKLYCMPANWVATLINDPDSFELRFRVRRTRRRPSK